MVNIGFLTRCHLETRPEYFDNKITRQGRVESLLIKISYSNSDKKWEIQMFKSNQFTYQNQYQLFNFW